VIKIHQKGFRQARANRARIRREFQPKMMKAVNKAAIAVKGQAERNVTGGNPLHVRSGRLRNSLTHDVSVQGNEIVGRVGTNVKYGPIHEFGGTIKPKVKEYLTFQVKPGQWVSVKQVVIPKREWLGRALKRQRKKVQKIYNRALGELYRGSKK
jgi:phage gpG-like protein